MSFLDGLRGIRTYEDQLIAREASVFPTSRRTRHTVVGAVFGIGDRNLEVFNVNRTPIEAALGVDLIYYHEEFDAWTLVQYKVMESGTAGSETGPVYRPDASFARELRRMRAFRRRYIDAWTPGDGTLSYRLCGDGFYFKFCSRTQFEMLTDDLLPGMYVPRQLIETVVRSNSRHGPRGGRLITFATFQRHITNSVFARLVRDAWIGTRGVSSGEVRDIVQQALAARRALVIGVGRARENRADLDSTRESLGL